jgi:hypothetical protein
MDVVMNEDVKGKPALGQPHKDERIKLTCIVHGDKPSRIFPISTFLHQRIMDLRDDEMWAKLHERHDLRIMGATSGADLEFYTPIPPLSTEVDDLDFDKQLASLRLQTNASVGAQFLRPSDYIFHYFPDEEYRESPVVHIVVKGYFVYSPMRADIDPPPQFHPLQVHAMLIILLLKNTARESDGKHHHRLVRSQPIMHIFKKHTPSSTGGPSKRTDPQYISTIRCLPSSSRC